MDFFKNVIFLMIISGLVLVSPASVRAEGPIQPGLSGSESPAADQDKEAKLILAARLIAVQRILEQEEKRPSSEEGMKANVFSRIYELYCAQAAIAIRALDFWIEDPKLHDRILKISLKSARDKLQDLFGAKTGNLYYWKNEATNTLETMHRVARDLKDIARECGDPSALDPRKEMRAYIKVMSYYIFQQQVDPRARGDFYYWMFTRSSLLSQAIIAGRFLDSNLKRLGSRIPEEIRNAIQKDTNALLNIMQQFPTTGGGDLTASNANSCPKIIKALEALGSSLGKSVEALESSLAKSDSALK